MECINIRVNNGRVDVTVDGAKLTDMPALVRQISTEPGPTYPRAIFAATKARG